jgi:hypothetical protein
VTMLGPDQLLTLAYAYSEATGLALSTVAKRACGSNHHFFNRLAKGHGANSSSISRVTEWLAANWPDNAEWPKGVPGKARRGGRMPPEGKRAPRMLEQPTSEESDLLEVSSVQDQPGEFKLRLRIDRVISGQLAIRILQMIGEDAVNASGTFAKSVLANLGKQGPE